MGTSLDPSDPANQGGEDEPFVPLAQRMAMEPIPEIFQDYDTEVRTRALAAQQKLSGAPAAPVQAPRLGDPLAASSPPEASPADSSGPTGRSGRGVGAIKQQILALGKEGALSPDVTQGMQAEFEVQSAMGQKLGLEYGKAEAGLLGLNAAQETLNKNRTAAVEISRQRMEKASKLAQYPGLTAQEIEQQEAIINDRSGSYTEQQKRAAQLSLKRASQIDPNRLMNTSTRNKIMAVLAQALGTYSSAMSNGRIPNYGMMAVEAAIDRDIMAQKAAFEQADKEYARERTLYADLRAQFDDEEQAIAAQKTILLNTAATMAERYKNVMLSSQLRQKALETQGTLEQREYSNRLDALAKAGGLASEQEKLDILAEKEAKKEGKPWIPRGAKAIGGAEVTTDKTLIRKGTNVLSQWNQVDHILTEVIKNRGELGAEVLNRVGVNRAEALWARLFARLRQIDQTGAHLSPQEAENIKKQIGEDPNKVGWLIARLETLQESLREEVDASIEPLGWQLDSEIDTTDLNLQPRVSGGAR